MAQEVPIPVFDFGEVVYLVAAVGNDDYIMKGQVVYYKVYPSGIIVYRVEWANGDAGDYFQFQLTETAFQHHSEN